MLKNLLTNKYINCSVRLMNDPFRPCRKGKGERVRLARRGWRPAKHICAGYPLRRMKLCAATGQRPDLENRGGVRRASSAVAAAGTPKKAENKTGRTVKALKSVFAVFQLEPAAVQPVPTQIGEKDFTAFPLILRMGMGGGGPEILILILMQVRRAASRFPAWPGGGAAPLSTE